MMARRRRDELSSRSRIRFNFTPLLVILVVAGILGLGVYWYVNPQSAPNLVRNYLPQAPARLYKWEDDTGQVQYSTQPPPADVRYEIMDYWQNANVIPSQSRRD